MLIREKVTIVTPDIPLPDVCRDKDDNHVLQLAGFMKADFIITGDKDLLVLNRYQSTSIVTPRAFYDRFAEKKNT